MPAQTGGSLSAADAQTVATTAFAGIQSEPAQSRSRQRNPLARPIFERNARFPGGFSMACSEVRTAPILFAAWRARAPCGALRGRALRRAVNPLPRAAYPLEFVSLFGYLSVVTAAYPRHLGGLPPAVGIAFYPHVDEPLGPGGAAASAPFATAASSSASTPIPCPSC